MELNARLPSVATGKKRSLSEHSGCSTHRLPPKLAPVYSILYNLGLGRWNFCEIVRYCERRGVITLKQQRLEAIAAPGSQV